VRGAQQDRAFRDAGLCRDGLADVCDSLAVDEQSVEADEGDAILAVVQDGDARLARVMQRLVGRPAVAARRLAADGGRDVALGEAGLEGRRGGLGGRRRGGEKDGGKDGESWRAHGRASESCADLETEPPRLYAQPPGKPTVGQPAGSVTQGDTHGEAL